MRNMTKQEAAKADIAEPDISLARRAMAHPSENISDAIRNAWEKVKGKVVE